MFPELVRYLPLSSIAVANKLRWRNRLVGQVLQRAARFVKNRDTVIQRGLGRGLRFNAGNSHSGYVLGTVKPDVQRVLAMTLRPEMVFYDIGANVGFFSMIAARLVGLNGRVICFEPLAMNTERIKHNTSLNHFSNVIVKQLALGSQDGSAEFSLSRFATFGRFSDLGAPDGYTGNTIVPVQRLDSVIKSGSFQPDFIKMDVEGAEVDVLKGGTEMLRESRPLLLIELHGTNGQMADVLADHDYLVEVLGGTNRDIRTAHWNANVFAVPKERSALIESLG